MCHHDQGCFGRRRGIIYEISGNNQRWTGETCPDGNRTWNHPDTGFMNVGTVGAIKGAVSTDDLRQIGTQVELSNTYHLHVRTGDKLIKEYGGLHQFMNWDKPILTDSGGFQVFPLQICARSRKKAYTSVPTLTDIRSSWDRKKVCRSSQILVPPLPWLLTSARQAMQIMIISAIP